MRSTDEYKAGINYVRAGRYHRLQHFGPCRGCKYCKLQDLEGLGFRVRSLISGATACNNLCRLKFLRFGDLGFLGLADFWVFGFYGS